MLWTFQAFHLDQRDFGNAGVRGWSWGSLLGDSGVPVEVPGLCLLFPLGIPPSQSSLFPHLPSGRPLQKPLISHRIPTFVRQLDGARRVVETDLACASQESGSENQFCQDQFLNLGTGCQASEPRFQVYGKGLPLTSVNGGGRASSSGCSHGSAVVADLDVPSSLFVLLHPLPCLHSSSPSAPVGISMPAVVLEAGDTGAPPKQADTAAPILPYLPVPPTPISRRLPAVSCVSHLPCPSDPWDCSHNGAIFCSLGLVSASPRPLAAGSLCPTSPWRRHPAVAVSAPAGETWAEGTLTTCLVLFFRGDRRDD